MSFTAIIINQNNERTISDSFKQIESLTDKIHIVDLNSKDKSLDKISGLDFKLNKAQNYSELPEVLNTILINSTSDYIFYLFAYEIIDKKHIEDFSKLINDNKHDAFIFKILHKLKTNDDFDNLSYSCRLFKKNNDLKFSIDTHLDISHSILEQNKKICTSAVTIVDSKYKLDQSSLNQLYNEELNNMLQVKQPSGTYYYFELAKSYFSCKKYKETVEELKRIDIKNLENKAFLASVYNLSAKALIEQGVLTVAAQLLHKSLDLIYHQNFAHIELCQTYHRQKKYTEASSLLEIYIGNHGLNPIIDFYKSDTILDGSETKFLPYVMRDKIANKDKKQLLLGGFLITEGRFEEGITILNDVLENGSLSSSNKYQAYSYLRVAYKSQGNNDKVFESLNAMIEYDSEMNRKDMLFKDLKEMTLLCANQNNMNNLSKFVDIGIKSYQYSMFYRYFRAYLNFKEKKYKFAINELNMLLDKYQAKNHKDISLHDIYILKANCYYEKKMYEEAINDYKNAFRYDQKKTDALYRIGKCLEYLEDKDGAAKVYQRVLKIDQNHEAAKEHLGQIVR